MCLIYFVFHVFYIIKITTFNDMLHNYLGESWWVGGGLYLYYIR